LAVGAAASVFGSLWGLRRRIRLRRWARDIGTGFLIIDREGERVIADHQVLSLALSLQPNYVNGRIDSVTRCFIVWLGTAEDLPERLEMVTTLAPDRQDPLTSLITRLSDRLYAQAKEDLQAGRSVLGENWTLQGRELIIRTKKETQTSKVEDVAAV